MKTTYLMNKEQPDGSVCLCVASSTEWVAAVKENKGVPMEQKRHFILDYIADGDDLDCMVIETSYEDYLRWDRVRMAEKRNREAGESFQVLSMNAPVSDTDDSGGLLDLIVVDTEVESTACDLVLMDELKRALTVWRPWACDLLGLYLQG